MLSQISKIFRGRPRVPPEELAQYRAALEPILPRLGAVYDRWRQVRELDSTDDEMANTASIQRWEVAGLLDLLDAVEPPTQLAHQQTGLVGVATDTARAFQRMSNGYRFHSSRSLCDGQALIVSVEERYRTLAKVLEQLGISGPSAAHVDA